MPTPAARHSGVICPELLAPRFRVLAVELYGAGASPEWPSHRVITLADEVALLAPVLAAAGSPLVLVGHSYGAAVALKAALTPTRAASPRSCSTSRRCSRSSTRLRRGRTTPTASAPSWSMTRRSRSTPATCTARRAVSSTTGAAKAAGNASPEQRKPQLAAQVANARRWGHACSAKRTPLAAFASLDMPVLYLSGKRSTASAHGVTRLLARTLPRAELVEFESLGHMGPVTDPRRSMRPSPHFSTASSASSERRAQRRLDARMKPLRFLALVALVLATTARAQAPAALGAGAAPLRCA
jgi:pimeloyl-ACP methyl ester carboxylesterase